MQYRVRTQGACTSYGRVKFASSLPVVSVAFFVACGGGTFTPGPDADAAAAADGGLVPTGPATALFAENAGASSETFFDAPYPSNLRLGAAGTPDVEHWPTAGKVVLANVLRGASERPGFPVVPVGYFRFDSLLPARDPGVVESRGFDGAFALVDVDPASPERGRTFPVVATTPPTDAFTPSNLFAVAARPGVVLHPKRTYAFVVFRKMGRESTTPIDLFPSATLAALAKGETPARADGAALAASYAPLWATLDQQKVQKDQIVAATVFTTGDAVEQTAQITDAILAKHAVTVDGLALEPDPTAQFTSFCHYTATVTMPQFQAGRPIFNSEGMFVPGADGTPEKQRDDVVNFSLSIPKRAMPEAGYPLVIYFHGSGGVAREFIDGAEKNEPGQLHTWPAFVLSDKGFAVAGTSLPIAPDRANKAQAFDYLNLNNPGAMLGTFRQGVAEQRLLLRALETVRLPKTLIDQCVGASLPVGATEAKFDLTRLAAQGQSMGGMYTNLTGAVEPKIKAAVPTGAGGYWMYFILETGTVGGRGLLKFLLGTQAEFSFMSPVLHLMETAFEPIDPMVSMPRLARWPLKDHPVRPIYEPVGLDDSYFPPVVYDAMVLAYGHPRAGAEVWSSMHDAQNLMGLGTVLNYPVTQNLTSETGVPYTGVVVQYKAEGDYDSHGIFRRLEQVRHQYGCFHETFQKTGIGVVPAPGLETDPCAP